MFVQNKPFGSLLEIFPKIISFYKHLIQYVKALKWGLEIIEIENRINLTLVKFNRINLTLANALFNWT